MRAVYFPNLDRESKSLFLENGLFHHLINVCRVQRGNNVLVMNGQGLMAKTTVVSIEKRKVELEILTIKEYPLPAPKAMAFSLPKKEHFDEIIKISTEIGLSDVYLLMTSFSQLKKINNERLERLLESAVIQSNNPYLPKVHNVMSLDQFLQHMERTEKRICYFSSRCLEEGGITKAVGLDTCVPLVGPEGGFSPEEEQKLLSNSRVAVQHIDGPIMRASTAVSFICGYLAGLGERT